MRMIRRLALWVAFMGTAATVTFVVSRYLAVGQKFQLGTKSSPYGLPPDATNVREIGNQWIVFDLEVDGRTRRFLFRHAPPGGLTELAQP